MRRSTTFRAMARAAMATVLLVSVVTTIVAAGGPTASAATAGFAWPASGQVAQNAAGHVATDGQRAVDIANAAPNTPVTAAFDGDVVYGGPDNPGGVCQSGGQILPKGYGNVVTIRHGAGTTTYYTTYGHLASVAVIGGHVTQGQTIGIMGTTGCTPRVQVTFAIGTCIAVGKSGASFVSPGCSIWNPPDPVVGTNVVAGQPTGGDYPGLVAPAPVNGVDLAFVIDTTSSMGPYINSVKAAALDIVNKLRASADARIAVVDYKDFYADCAEDGYASQVDLSFSTDNTAIQTAINSLTPLGGCDPPESVYSGVMTAIGLPWRAGVKKAIIVMGDAPPHDPEPVTGFTEDSVVAASLALDPAGVHTIDIKSGGSPYFLHLSTRTGATHSAVNNPEDAVSAILDAITTISQAPIASAGGPYTGTTNDTLEFDGGGSSSPMGHIVKWEWDFDSDGVFDAAANTPFTSHRYDAAYSGLVTLRVTDDAASPQSAIATASVSVTAAPRPAQTSGFVPLTPGRLFDTRDGTGGVPVGKLAAGQVLQVSVAGKLGLPPSGMAAVSLNVTATEPEGPGFITVYPCGGRPLASNVNYETGQTVPNAVIAPVSPAGTICLFTLATTHLLADVSGWYAVNSGFDAVTPGRLFDTRDGTGGVPVGKLAAGQLLEITVAGKLGLPKTGVAAVSLNVTATEPEGPGFVTVYPCGERPLASNVNYVTGQTVPNAVTAPVSPTGTICLYTLAATHLLADVSGWFAAGSGFAPVTPGRLFDTRDGTGGVLASKLAAGQVLEVSVAGKLGLPKTGVAAVSLNVTVTDPEGPGYITVYPCGPQPLASNVNYVAGQTVPNAVLAPVSPTGTICLYTLATTNLLADVSGWFAPPVDVVGLAVPAAPSARHP